MIPRVVIAARDEADARGAARLKGHSHKQIAYGTGRSERTVRQHAVQVYGKSGLAGRAELAAFFLEDLRIPGPSASS